MFNQKDQFIKIIVVSILISSLFGFLAGGLASSWFLSKGNLNLPHFLSKPNTQSQIQVLAQEETVVKAVKETSPAVVSIIATKDLPVMEQYFKNYNPFGDLFPGFEFQIPDYRQKGIQKQEVGGGTGFIVSADGLILTNKHVVDIQGADYTALTNDGQKYPAKVLAIDPVQDIAILKIDKKGLPVVKLGNSDSLEIGQSVIAIGNALGEFRNTVSVGVISGLKRSIAASTGFGSQAEQLEGVIQTDAAINPGNSGGPLLNLSGEVIGINVAIVQNAQSIGFALPINLAKRDISQVQKQGKIYYPFLGVRYVIVTPEIKAQRNLSVDYGALILSGSGQNEPAITPGSPAQNAGLQENDIILEVDGSKIDMTNTLAKIIQGHNVGDKISLKILHQGQEKTVQVTLGEKT